MVSSKTGSMMGFDRENDREIDHAGVRMMMMGKKFLIVLYFISTNR